MPLALAALAVAALVAYAAVLTATGTYGAAAQVCWWTALAAVLALALRRPLLRSRDRSAWLAVATAVAAWTAGDVIAIYGIPLSVTGLPSGSDAVFLLTYAALLAAAWRLARGAEPGARRGQDSLDGCIVALSAAGAVATALVVPVWSELVRAASAAPFAVLYPVLDVAVVVACLAGLGRAGGERRRALPLLAAGALLLLAGDLRYLVLTVAGGVAEDLPADLLWGGALLTWAAAGALPRSPRAPGADRARRALPVLGLVSGAVATVVLVLASSGDVPAGAVALAALTLVLCLVRLVLALREARLLADDRSRALRDETTGLPTARAAEERVEELVRRGAPFALVLLDVSGYKQLRLALGRDLGTELLVQIAGRLRASAAPAELVARAGEDEFSVVVPLEDPDGGAARAGELVRRFDESFGLDGINVHTRVTAGVAAFPRDGRSAADLLAAVELSTSHGSAGGQEVSEYSPAVEERARVRLALAGEIGGALARGEVVAHLQPQVRLSDGRVVGAEALVRWQHPRLGVLTPDRFLPALAHTHLMRRVTDAVLRQAAAQAAQWRPLGMTVAVNLSPSDLLDPDLPDRVSRILREGGALPGEVRLEVTEDAVMADADRIAETLAELRRRGLRIAVDDFGQGHSSLARLRDLPFDELKIDRAFLWRSADPSPAETAIVRAAVALAKDLSLEVVAEGLETPDAWHRLRDMGCDAVQGYWVSRPLAPGLVPAFLEEWPQRAPAAGAHLLR